MQSLYCFSLEITSAMLKYPGHPLSQAKLAINSYLLPFIFIYILPNTNHIFFPSSLCTMCTSPPITR